MFGERVMRVYLVHRAIGMTEQRSFIRWFHAEMTNDGVDVSETTAYRWIGTGPVPDNRYSEVDAVLERCIDRAAFQLGQLMGDLKAAK